LHDAAVVMVKKTLLPQRSAIRQAAKEIELATKERKDHKENKQSFSMCSLRSFVAKILHKTLGGSDVACFVSRLITSFLTSNLKLPKLRSSPSSIMEDLR
jgi:hypothetical protein